MIGKYIVIVGDNMNFSEFLKEKRGNMSLYKMAKATGISHTQITNYIKGSSEPTISNADKICRLLGVELVLGK